MLFVVARIQYRKEKIQKPKLIVAAFLCRTLDFSFNLIRTLCPTPPASISLITDSGPTPSTSTSPEDPSSSSTSASSQTSYSPPLSNLPNLETVYFIQNKISLIQGLDALGPSLRSLELGGNRIREIKGLDKLVNLEELWLGKNKIRSLEVSLHHPDQACFFRSLFASLEDSSLTLLSYTSLYRI
jgi:Leucine-rich repeat (LRR) protein